LVRGRYGSLYSFDCLGYLSLGFRRRDMGNRYSSRVGIRDYEFRVVDRHWPRGNANLRDPLAPASEVAHLDQPSGRSDDHLCRHVRGTVSALAPWPALVLLFPASLSQHDGTLAAISQRAGLGRFRRQYLFYGVAAVLVHGHDPRSGDPSRSVRCPLAANCLRNTRNGLAQLSATLAA